MAEAESYKAGLLQWDASTLSLRLDLLGFVTSLRIKWLFDRAEDVDVGTSLPLLVVNPETCKPWEETYSELTSESWYTKPTGYTYCVGLRLYCGSEVTVGCAGARPVNPLKLGYTLSTLNFRTCDHEDTLKLFFFSFSFLNFFFWWL